MGEQIFAIIIVGFFAVVAWLLWQRRFVFIIDVKSDRAVLRRGKVTAAFVQSVSNVCAEAGVSSARVVGVRRGKRIALQFSRSFPPSLQQRLRNEWQFSR